MFRSFLKVGINSRYIISALALLALLATTFIFYPYFFKSGEENLGGYHKAIKLLRNQVWQEERVTIYCGATYDEKGEISLPDGFKTSKHKARSHRIEWEHAVPVENFGRAFKEWREGDPACISKGKKYKGRKCASKVNAEFRAMEGDMYNLFPSIGSVNATRSNRQYAELPEQDSAFGSCEAKVKDKLFEPPDRAKGQVARAALYMDSQYSVYRLSRKQKRLFEAWDKQFPPDAAECRRAKRIQQLQGTENRFISKGCEAKAF